MKTSETGHRCNYFSDPRKVTQFEIQLLEQYARHNGSYAGVAKSFDVEINSFEPRFARIREKLGVATNERAVAVCHGEAK